ncbi:efflux RND transporter periplasmic adaptor subunit [Silvimonas amylolytica]|uniref:Uncharacterized protein n=1 Tax=Silvimonas amylolytica TaxID=449663 RepID=A0ABQ2PI27_9NEIS|nr:HlyD family efflux transporter periplasmic adaptor subunit [Silvimonas amylolytica]GGP24885.1 hypothetical protein GCM10010971_07040 [Silvimonas amylolytica]
MNDTALPHPQLLLYLDSLRDRALAAESLNALAFSMANDLYALLQFRQAMVFAIQGNKPALLSISGLAKPAEDSPYLVWLDRAARWINDAVPTADPLWLTPDPPDIPADIREGWAEWWPAGVWCAPVVTQDGLRLGFLLIMLEAPPSQPLVESLSGVRATWAYCWAALTRQQRILWWRPSRKQLAIAAVLLAALLLVPVRQTVLAPAEIVSSDAQVISSPIDGVIQHINVKPNQLVAAGTSLFNLDETSLRGRVEVLSKQVAVADAELMSASQRAFDNPQSRSELAVLEGTARQRRAELAAVQAQLKRTQVVAPEAGVAVFSDPNDWLGKPVVTGERILQLANPDKPAILIHLAVADAIALEEGDEVTLFLSAWPLSPVRGKIMETSYQAKTGDDGVVAYRLLASIDGQPAHARLGLHGTAKLYGSRVSLGYYLLRRPLAAARAWTGW